MAEFKKYSSLKGKVILKRRAEGETVAQLAKRFKVSTRSVSNWILKAEAEAEAKADKIKERRQKQTRKKKQKKKPAAAPILVHDREKLEEQLHKVGRRLNLKLLADGAATVMAAPPDAILTKEPTAQLLLQEIAYLHWWKEGELRGWVRRLLTEFQQCEEETDAKESLQTMGVLCDPKSR